MCGGRTATGCGALVKKKELSVFTVAVEVSGRENKSGLRSGSWLRSQRGGQVIASGGVCRVVLVDGLKRRGAWGSNAPPPPGAQNFTASGEAEARRCARREELLARGCPEQELEEPRGRQEVLQDKPLSQGDRGEGATQLAPQRIRVTLRPGGSRVAARGGCLGWASNALGC